MLTFARPAMKEVVLSYTNNLVERLIGKVAKRVKNRWMHWSAEGLENLLNNMLVRCCDRGLYASLKQKHYNDVEAVIDVMVT